MQRCPDCNRPLGRVSAPSEGLVYVCAGCEKKAAIECRYCGEPTLPELEGVARCSDCDVEVRFVRKRLVWSGEPEDVKVHWDHWGSFRYRLKRRFSEIERSLRHAAATSTVLDVEWERLLPFDEAAWYRLAVLELGVVGALVFRFALHLAWIPLIAFGTAGVWVGLEFLGRWLASMRWPATRVRVDADSIDVERGKRRRLFVRVDTEVSLQGEGIVLKDEAGSVTLPVYSRAAAEWLVERIAGVPLSPEDGADEAKTMDPDRD